MSYPGPSGPRGSQDSGGAESTARIVAAVITVAAVVAVLLIALITKYGSADDSSYQGGGTGPGVANGGGVSNGSGVSNGGGSVSATTGDSGGGGVSASVPPVSTAPGGSSGGGGTSSSAADLRRDFSTPPGSTKVSTYGDKYYTIHPTSGQDWYVTTSSLADTYAYYENFFKQHGWSAGTPPTVEKGTNGQPSDYYLFYENGNLDTSTANASMQLHANYLGDAPGKVLIQVRIDG